MCKIHHGVRLAISFPFGKPLMLRETMTDELLLFRFWCITISIKIKWSPSLNPNIFQNPPNLSLSRKLLIISGDKFALYSVYGGAWFLTSLFRGFRLLSRLVLISLLRILLPLLSGILLWQYLGFDVMNRNNECVTDVYNLMNLKKKASCVTRL